MSLFKGVKLHDRKLGRVIILEGRINPQGKDVKPYWNVRNLETDKITTIREDRLEGKRWTKVPV